MSQPPRPPAEMLDFYARGGEKGRLDQGPFPLERERTRELLLRYLPPPPAVVLDVGGAAGTYALWLAEKGYELHLVDPVPLHVEQAREASAALPPTCRIASARIGDARVLESKDASADVVLLLGPLYHLPEPVDRRAALAEARRVLRPGGWLFAAGISRFASLLDGLEGEIFDEPQFAPIVERDLETGRHVNDTGRAVFFTTAYFHHPEELRREVGDAGFSLEGVFALEGPGAFLPRFAERWSDPRHRETLLHFLRKVEREPALLGASPHLLAVAQAR